MKTFVIFLIKIILTLGIVCFALIDYRYFSFDKGFSKTEIENENSIDAVKLIESAPLSVEFYKNTIPTSGYEYSLFISTKDKNYIFQVDYEDIKGLNAIGYFFRDVKPEEITPIPFYVEIVVGFLILIIPFGHKQKE